MIFRAVFLLLAIACLVPAQAWPMYKEAPDHNPVFIDRDILDDPSVVWQTRVGNDVFASVVLDGGFAYVASVDGAVTCLDAATGGIEWQMDLGGSVQATPLISEGFVVVVTREGILHGLDAETGSTQWSTSVPEDVLASPALVDDLLYVATGETVQAHYINDGTVAWTFDVDGAVYGSPTIAHGNAYFGSRAGTLYAVDALTGESKWSVEQAQPFFSSVVASGDLVIAAARLGAIMVANAETGAVEWVQDAGRTVEATPTLHGGLLVVATTRGALHAWDVATGNLEWVVDGPRVVMSSPLMARDGFLFGSVEERVHAFDLDGNERWSMDVGDVVEATLAPLGDSVLFGTRDGSVYRIKVFEQESDERTPGIGALALLAILACAVGRRR